MRRPKKILTVSVASYNLGKLINQCLDSFVVYPEIIDDIEIIIVDDGSTDDTASRIKKYCRSYPHSFKLIQQKNSGPGSTVNTGIKNASGKYFRMVDGDDWVDPSAFLQFIRKLKTIDIDMVLTNYVTYHHKRQLEHQVVKVTDIPKNQLYNFENLEYHFNPPIRMHHATFRTDIMKKHVKLDDGFYTDSEYLLFPTPYIKTCIYYDLNLYIYRFALAGQSTDPKKVRQNLKNHRKVLDHLLEFYYQEQNKLNDNIRRYLAMQIAGFAVNHVDYLLTTNDDEMKNNIQKFCQEIEKKHPDIYQYFKNEKKLRLILASNFTLVKLLSFAYRKRYQLLNR